MSPNHDLDFINARRREREAKAAQHRLAKSIPRTRSSRRWRLARNRACDSAATSSHARSGPPTSLPARIRENRRNQGKQAQSTSAPRR